MTKAEKQALKEFDEWLQYRINHYKAKSGYTAEIRKEENEIIREQFKKLIK
jgi:hypothetical protein